MAGSRTWTVGKQFGAAIALPVIFLVLIGSYAYATTQRLLVATGAVAHTREVLTALSHTLSAFQDLETGQRGYVITGDEAFLEPYQKASGVVDGDVAELARLTRDNPRQQQRLVELGSLVERQKRLLAGNIELRRREGLEAAAKGVATGDGKRTMDTIRRHIDEMIDEEQALLLARTAAVDELVRSFASWLVGACVLAFLVVSGVGAAIVRSLSRKIGSAAARMRAAARELEAAATQQASSTNEQVATSQQVSVTIRELTATSRQIAESAVQVSRIAEDTSSAARGGDQTVTAARETVEGTRKQVDRVVTHMVGLNQRSQEIGGIVDIIRELAEQTNILAINATIEAAGAGEAGRRFGVVADEIRKLADRVAGAARNIQHLVEQVRGATNATVMATEDSAKAVEASTRRFADVGASFERIRTYVADTARSSREIEASTRHQTTAMEQVNQAMQSVSEAAREVQTSAKQTLMTASELSNVSEELLRLVHADEGSRRALAEL
ncbi:CHASE3 domain-containing protein [Polyangium sp. y55x31]|uniref:CHASE3 domain-containing protein n=1 Tax=Polyangium sp. y55x31 TaxID=3042688 RepID=UPI0024830BFF|nr:CHASE3 domain-containing protein [Polyangium sp. y55x31]MDI1477350.1 CHASE3 domain-containing protein [Polyangium sp. y55x31]